MPRSYLKSQGTLEKQQERGKVVGLANKGTGGTSHHLWKGEGIGYRSKHNYIRRVYGRADHCEKCGDKTKKVFHWANISGRYLREVSDYIQLCVSCHKRMDKETKKNVSKEYLLT